MVNFTDILVRLVIAGVFTLISMLFLTLSFFLLKRKNITKHNWTASIIFGSALFIFSFFPNILLSIIAGLLMLATIKYLYTHDWRSTFTVWGVWLGLWVALLLLVTIIIFILQPFASV